SGSSNVSVHLYGQPTQRSDQHIQDVTAAVKEIVLNIINTDDTGQLCFSYLGGVANVSGQSQLVNICNDYLANKNKQDAINLYIADKLAKSAKSDADLKAAQKANGINIGLGIKSTDRPQPVDK
ncbi:MAG: hypothetical protein Q7U58_13055, partial [Hydrogenophaga sp.]|nr:hypothetical protein [Hydrogenophaga sp.]